MRVLYWTTRFRPEIDGLTVLSVPVIHGLQAQGIEFLVVTSHTARPMPDETVWEDIPVRRYSFYRALLSRDPRQIAALARSIARLKQDFQPDLIHINTVQPDLLFHQQTLAAWDCAVLVTVHQPIVTPHRNSLVGRALQNATWVTAVSEATLAEARRFMPEIWPRSCAILNGLDMSALEPAPINWRQPRLLCVGRVVEDKGFDLAIRAVGEIRRQFPQALLRIAGEGEVRPELEALVERLGLGDAVEFLGWVEPEQIPALINDSVIVLMPSRREPFGLAALQAGQMARPVIASAVGGLPEIVVDGETGFLVEAEQAGHIAEKALWLLNHPEQGRAMGLAGRSRAQNLFTMERVVNEYGQVYRMLAS